jgi:DNA glycosylase AlkZ-like
MPPPVRPSSSPVLDAAALGRATLARQLLLERSTLDPVSAIHRLGGLQAQEPASPSIALWTRLEGFSADALQAAVVARTVVKATLFRGTLHLVTGPDYARLRPAIVPSRRGIRRPDRNVVPDDEILERAGDAALLLAREPRSLGELRDHVADDAAAAELDADALLWWVRRERPLVHAPDATQPWSYGRRPRLVDAAAWLPDLQIAPPSEALAALVRTHLAAFGPATAADIGAWSGLPVGRLRPAIDALDAADALWHGRDERGRRLLDLPDALRPAAATPSPPRLLPMWDNVLLAHADRSRLISDADRALVIARNGDTLPTILVDGRVAGCWWVDPGPGGRPRITIEPFRPIPAAVRRSLEREGERLAAFVEPVEPTVYARYQRWRRPPA